MAKKLYYKIGEACKTLDIQPYVLRYWETEFPQLSPSKSSSGQRVYSETDLRVIRRIKELLYDEGYTIAGAKKKLESERPPAEAAEPEEPVEKEPPKARAKPKAAKAPKPKAAAPGRAASGAAEPRVEKLTRGVEKALVEARELLSLLDS